jgi:hypothetical protein
MKTITKLLTVFALALTAFLGHGSASAGGGGSFNFKGPSALANFSSVDGSGCVQTEVLVIGSDWVNRVEPGPTTPYSFASVSISQYDFCNGIQLMFAYGDATPLPEPGFEITSQLDAATLNGTAYMYDEVSGTNFNMDMHVTWTASGALTRSNDHSNLHAPGCIVNSRSSGTSRWAQAVGTVSNGLINFTPQPSYDASLVMVRAGTVTVGCE